MCWPPPTPLQNLCRIYWTKYVRGKMPAAKFHCVPSFRHSGALKLCAVIWKFIGANLQQRNIWNEADCGHSQTTFAADIRSFRVLRMGRRTVRERSGLSRHWRCALELPSSLCQAFVFFTLLLSQNWKLISSPLHTDLSFYQSITSNACICSVCGFCFSSFFFLIFLFL